MYDDDPETIARQLWLAEALDMLRRLNEAGIRPEAEPIEEEEEEVKA